MPSQSQFAVQFVFMVTLILSPLWASAAGNRTYDQAGNSIAEELRASLVQLGVCKNSNECAAESRVLFVSRASGLHFSIYGRLEPRAIASLLATLGQRGRQLPVGAKLEAEFVSLTKAEDLARSPLSAKPLQAQLVVSGAGT
jgi:hypothetical protein